MNNPPSSLLQLLLTSVGPTFAIVLPLAGILSFLLTFILVTRGRGAMAAASILLVVNLPLFIGIILGVKFMVDTNYEIVNGGATPDPNILTETISSAFVAPFFGILVAVPGYLVALFGTLVRTLFWKVDDSKQDLKISQ